MQVKDDNDRVICAKIDKPQVLTAEASRLLIKNKAKTVVISKIKHGDSFTLNGLSFKVVYINEGRRRISAELVGE